MFEVAPGITAIDTYFDGHERYTAAYVLDADEPAIVETGPTTSFDHVVSGLDALGIGREDLAHVVVTHIHLDHAGGVGRIAEHYPRAAIWVHERGARHLADPSRLVASAERIYGPELLASRFGAVESVAPQRLRAVDGGAVIDLGGRTLDVLATPGHAKHHMALVDSATGAVFTGDALGIHPPDAPVLRPATPPPDYDLELAGAEAEDLRRPAPCRPRRAPLAGGLDRPPAQQHALEVRRGHVVAERGLVQLAELGEREGLRREREGDVRVRELRAQPLAPREDDRAVVERRSRKPLDRVPARVGRDARVDAERDETEVGRGQLPALGVPAGVAPRAELLEVGDLADVDLRREVAEDRLLERLVRRERAAG